MALSGAFSYNQVSQVHRKQSLMILLHPLKVTQRDVLHNLHIEGLIKCGCDLFVLFRHYVNGLFKIVLNANASTAASRLVHGRVILIIVVHAHPVVCQPDASSASRGHEECVHVLKSFKHVFNAWTQPRVPDKHILHEVYQVHIVVDFVKFVRRE